MIARWPGIFLAAAFALPPVVTAACAQTPIGLETSLIYLDSDEWTKQTPQRKIALAADFMRIFCTDQTMPPATLADCLDRDGENGPMLERAIACVSGASRAK
jgi:hypothetical protein